MGVQLGGIIEKSTPRENEKEMAIEKPASRPGSESEWMKGKNNRIKKTLSLP